MPRGLAPDRGVVFDGSGALTASHAHTDEMTNVVEETVLRLPSGQAVRAVLRVAGHQRKCLLIHGNPGSLADWQRVTSLLASTADVAAIDLPGFGESERPHGGAPELSLNRLAECMTAVLDALSWRTPVFVVGHSHGGGVAQTLAAQHRARVAGIVLLGSLGSPAHLSYRLLSAPGASVVARTVGASLGWKRLRPIGRWLIERVSRDIFAPEAVAPETVARQLEQFAARPEVLLSMVEVALGKPCQQLLASAAAIRCPVLFLHGARDKLVPLERARAIHRKIEQAGGDSRFEVLEEAGHMLLEFQAAEVAARIVQFMGR